MKKKETLFIAFSTQKGEAGKTTLTVLAASYLHYVKGYNVAAADCDCPQFSIADMRRRDVEQVMKDSHYKRMAHIQFTAIAKNAYTVEECSSVDAIAKAEQLQVESEPDFIFFDLPGTMNAAGVVKHSLRWITFLYPSAPTGWCWKARCNLPLPCMTT